MSNLTGITEHMEIIGADGVHVGTVDKVEGGRIKLTKTDAGEGKHEGHHHYIEGIYIAGVEDGMVRLSANAMWRCSTRPRTTASRSTERTRRR